MTLTSAPKTCGNSPYGTIDLLRGPQRPPTPTGSRPMPSSSRWASARSPCPNVLPPGRRAVDRAPVRKRHHLRQLAPRGQVAGDVRVVGGDTVQMLGVVWGRIKMQGACASRPRPLPRIGRASRSDINPLTGSDGSVPHRRAWCKGVCKKTRIPNPGDMCFIAFAGLFSEAPMGVFGEAAPFPPPRRRLLPCG